MSCSDTGGKQKQGDDFALAFITPTKPTYATLPLPGIQPVLMNDKGVEIEGIKKWEVVH
jgi:hypothetical protein